MSSLVGTADVLIELDTQLASAALRHDISVSDHARAYTVGLLGSYIRAEAYPSITVVEYRKDCDKPALSKNLGDYCLFLYGLFYERAHQRGFSDFHRETGIAAYNRYSHYLSSFGQQDTLFAELSARFEDISVLIGDLRLAGLTDEQLLDIVEKQMRKPSSRYKALLQTKGVILPTQPFES